MSKETIKISNLNHNKYFTKKGKKLFDKIVF